MRSASRRAVSTVPKRLSAQEKICVGTAFVQGMAAEKPLVEAATGAMNHPQGRPVAG